ncbi:MAG: DUF2029 domain-containing protein [Deltaproteobacteria bacterium]|nr:DUF2029 domain-containing protein [Deltaproteobacteria bacterium]
MALPKILHNKIFILSLGILLFAITYYVFVVDCSRRALLDFEVYLAAAKTFAAGGNIYAQPYDVSDRWERHLALYYLYPPLLAQVLSKFLTLSQASLAYAWCLCAWLCIVGSAWCIAELISYSWWKRWSKAQRFLLVYFFLVCFEPVYWGVSDGQVSAIVLLLLSIFLLADFRDKPVTAGSALALAVLIKMSPLLLLLGVMRLRRWKTLIAFGVSCLALNLWLFSDAGSTQPILDFIHSLRGIGDERASRGFLFNFVFDKSLLAPFGLENDEIARCIVRASLVALPVLAVLKIRDTSRYGGLALYALLICFMLVCSPLIWFHHLAWALLPIAVLSCTEKSEIQVWLRHLTVCVGLYFGLSQVNLIHYWTFKELPQYNWISSLVPTTLLLLLASCLWRSKESLAPSKEKDKARDA